MDKIECHTAVGADISESARLWTTGGQCACLPIQSHQRGPAWRTTGHVSRGVSVFECTNPFSRADGAPLSIRRVDPASTSAGGGCLPLPLVGQAGDPLLIGPSPDWPGKHPSSRRLRKLKIRGGGAPTRLGRLNPPPTTHAGCLAPPPARCTSRAARADQAGLHVHRGSLRGTGGNSWSLLVARGQVTRQTAAADDKPRSSASVEWARAGERRCGWRRDAGAAGGPSPPALWGREGGVVSQATTPPGGPVVF